MLEIYVGDVYLYREVGMSLVNEAEKHFLLPYPFCFIQLISFLSLTLSPFFFFQLSFWLFLFIHSALSEEEKTLLRAGLITNFNEPVNQVSRRTACRWFTFHSWLRILFNKKTCGSFVFIMVWVWIEGASFTFVFVGSSSMFRGYVQGQEQKVWLFVWCRCFEIGFKAAFHQM